MKYRITNPKHKKLGKIKFFFLKRYLPIHLFWISNFNRNKLKKNLNFRRDAGHPDCKDCGLCCYGCPVFDKNTGLCTIWKDADYRCKVYPMSPLQLKTYGIQDFCRYYWEEDKNDSN